MMPELQAEKVLAAAREAKPGVRYAMHRDGNAIGGWVESLGRFAVVASRTPTGQWVSMPWELLVNGSPCHSPDDWTE